MPINTFMSLVEVFTINSLCLMDPIEETQSSDDLGFFT